MTAVAAERATVLALDDVHCYLGESHVLQGVSFDVAEGTVTALLGRNGVGKTTTLRGIMGLVPRRGRIELVGEDVGRLPTHEIVRRGVGYVPEDRDVFAGLSVEENLRLAERDDEPRYELVYDLFPELRDRGRQRAGTLSGGQQQMLAIARALLNDNRLLLIDEPTKGLAPFLVTQVADVLERASEFATILLVEQNLGVVRRIARDAVVLDQGRVVHRATRGRCSPTRRRCVASSESPDEHLRPAHDHGARARRDVLPDRVGAVAHLRADGRAQLRARRVPLRRRVRRVVVLGPAAGTIESIVPRFLLASLLGLIVGGVLAVLVELVLIRPLYLRHIEQVLVTVGLSLALVALLQGIWGPTERIFEVPGWLYETTSVLGAEVPNDRFVEIGVAVAVLIGLLAFLRYTRYGLIIRAGVENRAMVTALGIDVRKAFTLVFALGGVAAALAGVLSGVYFGAIDPERGTSLLIFAFIVVVIGGLGSIGGSAVAAVIVGLTQQYANYYASSGVGDLAVIMLLALTLLIRPSGLAGKWQLAH